MNVVLWHIVTRYCSKASRWFYPACRLCDINFARATDDVPCRARILFTQDIWLGRACGDGGYVGGACDLVSVMILISASLVSMQQSFQKIKVYEKLCSGSITASVYTEKCIWGRRVAVFTRKNRIWQQWEAVFTRKNMTWRRWEAVLWS